MPMVIFMDWTLGTKFCHAWEIRWRSDKDLPKKKGRGGQILLDPNYIHSMIKISVVSVLISVLLFQIFRYTVSCF